MKNVIHIFGASGSGTSTLGKKISSELGYTFMDTDDYYWMPTDPKFTVKRPIDERISLMKRDIDTAENVVISGSLCGWGDVLIPYFTLAVRIVIDTDLRIERIKARERERFGSRIDVGGDMHQQHIEFIEWARSYDTADATKRSKARHDEWERLLPCEVLHIDGAESLEDKLLALKKKIL